MSKPRISIATVLVPLFTSLLVFGCASASKPESKSMSISQTKGGDGLVVVMSQALARSMLEGIVGAHLECGADLDSEFATMLHELDRGGRGSRATIRNEDGVLTARRSGRSFKLDFDEADGGGGLQIKMPWAVAECLLDESATLTEKDAGSIRVKLVGSEGGSFEFKVGRL